MHKHNHAKTREKGGGETCLWEKEKGERKGRRKGRGRRGHWERMTTTQGERGEGEGNKGEKSSNRAQLQTQTK